MINKCLIILHCAPEEIAFSPLSLKLQWIKSGLRVEPDSKY